MLCNILICCRNHHCYMHFSYSIFIALEICLSWCKNKCYWRWLRKLIIQIGFKSVLLSTVACGFWCEYKHESCLFSHKHEPFLHPGNILFSVCLIITWTFYRTQSHGRGKGLERKYQTYLFHIWFVSVSTCCLNTIENVPVFCLFFCF